MILLSDSDPRLFPDRAYKHPPPELRREVQGAGSAASGPPPEPRFTPLGLDRTYGHQRVAPRCTEPIRVCLDYHITFWIFTKSTTSQTIGFHIR